MDKQKFIELLDKFVEKYQDEKIIDDKLKLKVLKNSTAWNKETVMVEFIKRIDEHRLYEEKGFPFISYVNKFLSGQPIPVQTIKEEDFS